MDANLKGVLMEYRSGEGPIHHSAKVGLRKWLRFEERAAREQNRPANFLNITWQPHPKYSSVQEEVPFYVGASYNYFTHSSPFVDMRQTPLLFVPDLVVFEYGAPRYFLEIFYSHIVSEKKKRTMKEWFDREWAEVPVIYEMDAFTIAKFRRFKIVPPFLPMRLINLKDV